MNNSDFTAYGDQLAQATRTPFNPPELDDVVNDNKRFIKSGLEGLGSTFIGHSITKGLEGIKKGSKVLDNLDISDEDLEGLQTKIESGDIQGAAGSIFKGASRRVTSAISQRVGKTTKSVAQSAVDKITSNEPTTQQDILRASIQKITGGLRRISGEATEENLVSSAGKEFSTETAIADRARGAYGAASNAANVTSSGSRAVDEAVDKSAEDDAMEQGEKDVARQGEKEIEEQIEKKTVGTALKESVAEDAEAGPVGLIVTAGLGIASLIMGIRTDDHKKVWKRPPVQTNIVNYSNQSGVN